LRAQIGASSRRGRFRGGPEDPGLPLRLSVELACVGVGGGLIEFCCEWDLGLVGVDGPGLKLELVADLCEGGGSGIGADDSLGGGDIRCNEEDVVL
jgi:hypothetical protein